MKIVLPLPILKSAKKLHSMSSISFCQLRKSNYFGFYIFNCSSFFMDYSSFFGDTCNSDGVFAITASEEETKDEETQFVIFEPIKKSKNRSSVQASSSMIKCQHDNKVDRFLQDHNCKKGEKLSDLLLRSSGSISDFFSFTIFLHCSLSSSSHMFTFVVDTLRSKEA